MFVIYSFNELQEQVSSISQTTTSSVYEVSSDLKRLEDRSTDTQAQLLKHLYQKVEEKEEKWRDEKKALENDLTKRIDEVTTCLNMEDSQDSLSIDEVKTELKEIRERFLNFKNQVQRNISTLTKTVSLMENESRLAKREVTQVLEAEIKTRYIIITL